MPDQHNSHDKNHQVYRIYNSIPISFHFFKTIISPAIAALSDRLFFHPIENIITVQQIWKLNFFQAAKKMYRENGLKQFYRGLSWPLLFAIPDRLTMYGSYFLIKDFLQKKKYCSSKITLTLTSGVLAGVVDAIAACPPESQRIRAHCGIKQPLCLKTLYRGFSPMVFKTVVGTTMIMGGSDYILETMPQSLRTKYYTPFVVGLFTGVMAQLLITPADVLKTRLMSDYSNKKISTHLVELQQRKMLYMGLVGRMVRIGGGASLMIGLINYLNNYFADLLDEQSDATMRQEKTLNPESR